MTEIDKIIERLKTDGRKFGISLNPPAADADILKFETVTQIQLPSDIKEFYKKCNGFDADDDFLFRVIPLKDIAEEKGRLPKNRFHLAEYMIYSDSWIIELKDDEKYVIVNSNHGTEDEVILCDSIVAFLNRYLEGDGAATANGLYKWL
jgi:hypothetical protein